MVYKHWVSKSVLTFNPKCWLVLTNFWVKYNFFLGYFNPTAWFVTFWPNTGSKTSQHFCVLHDYPVKHWSNVLPLLKHFKYLVKIEFWYMMICKKKKLWYSYKYTRSILNFTVVLLDIFLCLVTQQIKPFLGKEWYFIHMKSNFILHKNL